MQSRREFLRSAAALTGSAFVWGTIPEAIARAARIDPEIGTTYQDAEHVVILMQENRSFDHCYGALRGVRGFRDPRVHRQPDGRPVWFQTDAEGKTYAPFRLDLKRTNSTWIGGLPHTWPADWRRTVCGNLTSVFRPYHGEHYSLPASLDRDETLIGVHKAQFARRELGPVALGADEIRNSAIGAAQERGTRPSCFLPYELEANARFEKGSLFLILEARNLRFGANAAGAPFSLYHYGGTMTSRAYAVKAGDKIEDSLTLPPDYHVRLDGPNGFCRDFSSSVGSPEIDVFVEAGSESAITVRVTNRGSSPATVVLHDRSYGAHLPEAAIGAHASITWQVDVKPNQGWYDFSVDADKLSYRYSGRLETGEWSISDPAMG